MNDLKQRRPVRKYLGLLCLPLLSFELFGCGNRDATTTPEAAAETPPFVVRVYAEVTANNGRPARVLIHAMDPDEFASMNYEHVVERLLPLGGELLGDHMIFPGKRIEVPIDRSVQDVGVFVLLTDPRDTDAFRRFVHVHPQHAGVQYTVGDDHVWGHTLLSEHDLPAN